MRTFPGITLAGCWVGILVALWPGLASACVYERSQVASGELWRLVTCNVVHFSSSHLFYDLLAFAIAGCLLELRGCRNAGVFFVLCPIAVGLEAHLLQPGLERFGGLSGVATGAVVLAALQGFREREGWRWVFPLALVGVAGKMVVEVATGQMLFADGGTTAIQPVAGSHLTGSVVALLIYVCSYGRPNWFNLALGCPAGQTGGKPSDTKSEPHQRRRAGEVASPGRFGQSIWGNMKWLVLCSAASLGFFPGAGAALTPEQIQQLPASATRPVKFTEDIRPILEARCANCHGRGRSKGGFQIDTRETFLKGGDSGLAVVSGKSAESYLIELVSGLDPDNIMPQKGTRLTAEQVSLMRGWIDQGLPWDQSVTFARAEPRNLRPRRPELPPASRELTHPVDRWLHVYFTSNRMEWPRPVEDGVFARRAWLDVVGLAPQPQELERFVSDRTANKRETLVKRLLVDKQRYAEHWLSFWNDLLRNDYRGTGYIDGGRKQISAWLFSALVNNVPYDQFVAELINPTPAAEGFTRGIIWRGVVNASQTPQMQAAQNISQVFMGVNLKCASCHDSFINDWKLSDAYGLANIYADEPLDMFECDKPTGRKASVQFIYPTLGQIDAGAPKSERLKRLAELITSKEDGRLARTMVNRLWAVFFGRGLVEPLDDMEQLAWHADLLDWLAEDLVEHDYDLKHTMARLLTSRAYQLPSVDLKEGADGAYIFRGPVVRRMTAEQFVDAVSALGDTWHDKPAGEFDFTCLGAENDTKVAGQWIWNDVAAAAKAPAGRIYLRKSLTLKEKPTQAQAVVVCDNSFTLYVNGKNVGAGKDYTKPAVIDLAPHLKKGGNLLAAVAINHTPDNAVPPEDKPADPASANPAGFFFSLRLRDGEQRLEVGSDASWLVSTNKIEGWNKVEFDANQWARAIELGGAEAGPWALQARLAQAFNANALRGKVRASMVAADALTTALGRPNREQVTTSRPVTATTLQMLELTNGRKLAESLRNVAGKLVEKADANLPERLFVHALGRRPSSEELQLARQVLGSPARAEGAEDLLWSLVMLPDFQLIY